MPSISGLVSAISDDVVAKLFAAGATPLVDEKILIGRQHIYEMSSPPRVVFIPISSTYGPRGMYNRSVVSGAPSSEMTLQTLERSILTETTHFEVHVWGIASPPDPEGGDFDATQVLYQQVIASTHLLACGSYKIENGKWTDQAPSASQMIKAGHEYVFMLSLDTPILDQPAAVAGNLGPPLGNVPNGTKSNSTVILELPDGSTEVAATGV